MSAGRPECADCVLCPGQVDRDLAADRRIRLGKPRRRHVYQGHSPMVESGSQSTNVAHGSAAGNDQRVGAFGADRGQPLEDLFESGHGLGVLATLHRAQAVSGQRVDKRRVGVQCACVRQSRRPASYRGFDQSAEPLGLDPAADEQLALLKQRPPATRSASGPDFLYYVAQCGIAAYRDVDGPIERLALRRRSRQPLVEPIAEERSGHGRRPKPRRQHVNGRIQPDTKSVFHECPAIQRIEDCPTARRDDGALYCAGLCHRLPFESTKGRFALLFDELCRRASRSLLNQLVRVNKRPAQALRDEPANGCLATPRHANQDDAISHRRRALFGDAAVAPRRLSSRRSCRHQSWSATRPPARARPSPRPRSRHAAGSRRRSARCGRGRVAPVTRSTESSGLRSVATGLTAARTTIGIPLLMPPSMPPARLVRRAQSRGFGVDLVVDVRCHAYKQPKAEPDLDALDRLDGHQRRRQAHQSRRVSHSAAEPSPIGTPSANDNELHHRSSRPPRMTASISSIMRASAAGSGQRSGDGVGQIALRPAVSERRPASRRPSGRR